MSAGTPPNLPNRLLNRAVCVRLPRASGATPTTLMTVKRRGSRSCRRCELLLVRFFGHELTTRPVARVSRSRRRSGRRRVRRTEVFAPQALRYKSSCV